MCKRKHPSSLGAVLSFKKKKMSEESSRWAKGEFLSKSRSPVQDKDMSCIGKEALLTGTSAQESGMKAHVGGFSDHGSECPALETRSVLYLF